MTGRPYDPAHDGPAAASDPPRDIRRRLEFLQLDEDDRARLRSLAPVFRSWADEFVEQFYRHLFTFPEASQFLQDPTLVARLKDAQRQHFESMLEAAWDQEYVERRRHVGHVHAEVGIEPDLFLGAYSQYVQHSFRQFAGNASPVHRQELDRLMSVLKAVFLDIGLTLDAYFAESTQSLRHALDMFWKANTELKQFAQFTSHDLKTPLATVANLCDEALDEFGDEIPAGARQLIEAARQRAFQMSKMIDELLASSLVSGITEEQEEISSLAALEEAIDRVQPLFDEKDIELETPPHLPLVWGNQARLSEVFYNLLSNAAKFIDKRPGKVAISCQPRDGSVVFCVADNGPGIPPEELARIFVPFRRLPRHRNQPGSGLGLYFTKNFVENQGGRVWAESEPGQGSRFYVELRNVPH